MVDETDDGVQDLEADTEDNDSNAPEEDEESSVEDQINTSIASLIL